MSFPEKATLIERFVGLIPVRYPFAAIVWSFVVGSPIFHLVEYLDHGSTSFSLAPSALVSDLLFTAVPFYVFYVVRYLRLNILNAEPQIVPIMSDGEAAYHSAFRRITSTPPVLILGVVLTLTTIPAVTRSLNLSIQLTYTLVSLFVIAIAVATYVWSYAWSSWGLHKLGESDLKLRSFLEDRTMGANAIGSLALSQTVAYFGGILLVFFLFFSYLVSSLSFQALISAFFAVGIIMFFLPLNSLHKKMQAEKLDRQKTLTLD